MVNGNIYEVFSAGAANPFAISNGKIIGIYPEADASELPKFEDAWASMLVAMNIVRHKILSRDGKTWYTVTSFNGKDHVCSCPARGNCWHIRYIIQKELAPCAT